MLFVSKGEKMVAAIEVDPERWKVAQALAKANRSIEVTEDLGLAVVRWARDKGVCLRGDMFR